MRPYEPLGLPIDAVIDDVQTAVSDRGAVITAEPGAGKSSVVPLLASEAVAGVVYLTEPRRVAARATAQRLAELAGTEVGDGVGLVMRGERKVSKANQIVVVTEGVLAQMLRSDPELDGIGAIIFDEFHERSLQADLGLAMSCEVREAFRPDLSISVMSATIDANPVATLLSEPRAGAAPIIAAAGRTFPIATRWSHRATGREWAPHVAALTATAYRESTGSVLVFVPGRREIRDVMGQLRDLGMASEPLHGGTDSASQRRLLSPSSERRIIVATSVAETSLTIPGIEAVVDGGLARRASYDQRTGLGRLVTGFVTRFAADQRQGRAGRLGPGVCFRAWSQEDHRLLDNAPSPEILSGDPLDLGSALALWGDPYGDALPLLDRPPTHRLDAAYARLSDLGLTTKIGGITDRGRLAGALGAHPRTSALLLAAPATHPVAATAAALIESDHYPTSDDFEAEMKQVAKKLKREADRFTRGMSAQPTSGVTSATPLSDLLAIAWPDRVAVRRPDEAHRYVLATGSEVRLRRNSPLTGSEALVVVDADADMTSGFIARAVPLTRVDALAALEPLAGERHEVIWDDKAGRVRSERVHAYGSIIFKRQPDADPPAEAVRREVIDAVRRSSLELLTWSSKALDIHHRLSWLHDQSPDEWPDVSTATLVDRLDDWLDVGGAQSRESIAKLSVASSLLGLLDWQQRDGFKRLAPATLATPMGHNLAVNYESGEPVWSVRLQWLLGLDSHPTVGPDLTPVTIELLSPASRPVQRTKDLPGFWRGSYSAVRSDLRGRYPKHSWPSDPLHPD